MIRHIRLFFSGAFLLGLIMGLYAQDPHYSQYYAAPLTLNPALTGKFNGEWRVGGIYRSQWAPVDKPLFATPSVAVDFSLLKGVLARQGDALGVGLHVMADKQNGDGAGFMTYSFYGSLAYHKALGRNKGTQISLGFQGGYIMKQLKYNNLRFGEGFVLGPTGYTYDASRVGEPAFQNSANNMDFNAGLFANSKVHPKVIIYGGYAMMHIGRPTESFFASGGGLKGQIDWRHVGHAGAEWSAARRWVVIPGALYQFQGKAQEINFGVTGGYHFRFDQNNQPSTIFLGLWNRLSPHYNSGKEKAVWGEESIIPKMGLEYNRIRLQASLDVPLSKLRKTTGGKNGDGSISPSYRGNLPLAFEISLSYIGRVNPPKEDRYLFNPRF